MGNVYQQQAELLVAMAHTICAYSKGSAATSRSNCWPSAAAC